MDEVMSAELRRLYDEEARQNKRLDLLEQGIAESRKLALSVEKLAINMEHMLTEQKEQGQRLEKLEAAPAEQWSNMKKTVFNTLVGALAGALAAGVLGMIAQYVG